MGFNLKKLRIFQLIKRGREDSELDWKRRHSSRAGRRQRVRSVGADMLQNKCFILFCLLYYIYSYSVQPLVAEMSITPKKYMKLQMSLLFISHLRLDFI